VTCWTRRRTKLLLAFLVTGKLGDAARERIRTMVESTDGFYIAEMDLKLRGPGEFFRHQAIGTSRVAHRHIIRDKDVLELARSEAQAFIASPPSAEELRRAVTYIREHWQTPLWPGCSGLVSVVGWTPASAPDPWSGSFQHAPNEGRRGRRLRSLRLAAWGTAHFRDLLHES